MEWKKDVEKKSSSWFIQHRQAREGQKYKTLWFYCNRSGDTRKRGAGKRSMKIQGSSKMNEHCSAFMKVMQDNTTKTVEVQHSLTHIGHNMKFGHLRMSEELRTSIAGKLARKIPVEAILDEIRDDLCGKLCRDHLTSKQDVHNIMHQFNINHVQKHTEDSTSINCWVHDLRDQVFNIILCYKPQGQPAYGLPNKDFLLGFQTEFQRDTMIKYASSLVCIDSTHCTTGYDFLLITVLVKDDYGEGVPVAWLISNREDICALDPFFAELKLRVGNIEVGDFMSDDAGAFYNAWTRNFPAPKRQLLCAWHVDKAIRSNILRHVRNVDDQANLYRMVKLLQIETDKKEFKKQLQSFCAYAEDHYPEFWKYFSSEFLQRQEMWGYCYRTSTAANTNMALESFHRVLKTCYLQRKRNRRVDHLLAALLKIARDKAFEAWGKWEKGKRTSKIKDISKRHKESLQIDASIASKVANNEWSFPSSSTNAVYSVLKEEACNNCKMKCTSCSVCIHEYSCTCPDFSVHSVPCKHIHALHSSLAFQHQIDQAHSDTRPEGSDYKEEQRAYFEDKIRISERPFAKIEGLRTGVIAAANTLLKQVELCNNAEALSAARMHLNNAISVLKGISSTDIEPLEGQEKIAPNRNFEKQLRFYSTKKKREPRTKVLAKPTMEDKAKVRDAMKDVQATLWGICFEESDKSTKAVVDWLECSRCYLWVHVECDATHARQD